MSTDSEDKIKFLLVGEEDEDQSVIIDWSNLKEEVLDNIPAEMLYNVMAVDDDGTIVERTIVYLRPVSKFSKKYKKFDNGDIIIGIEI